MRSVERMDFSTPCCTKPPEPRRWLARAWVGLWLLGGLWLGVAMSAWAQAAQLQRDGSGLYLSARLDTELPDGLEDVLLKGVPVHFIWQADVRRSRWYWTDQRLATAQRVVRLAYQPLTRRWRLSIVTGVADEAALAGALHRNLDSLDEALAVVKSVARWRIALADELPEAGDLRVDVQMRIDSGLLPRPFQVGAGADWGVVYRATIKVPEPAPAEPTGADKP